MPYEEDLRMRIAEGMITLIQNREFKAAKRLAQVVVEDFIFGTYWHLSYYIKKHPNYKLI